MMLATMNIGPNYLQGDGTLTQDITKLCWPSYQRTAVAMGGDAAARFSFPISRHEDAEIWLDNRLGWHFEERADGERTFSGYIHAVRAMVNGVLFSVTLDDLANRIAVRYQTSSAGSPATTAYADNEESVRRFGRKMLVVDSVQEQFLPTAAAEALRDNLAEKRGRPRVMMEQLQEGKGEGFCEIEVRGYTSTMDWILYESGAGTSTQQTALAFIISAIDHTGSPDNKTYVPRWQLEDELDLTVQRETPLKGSWARMKEILSLGTSAGGYMRAGCLAGNQFLAVPVDITKASYFVRYDGQGRLIVTDEGGAELAAPHIQPGRIAVAVSAIPGRALASPVLDDPRAFFIDSVSYSAAGVKLHNARATVNTRALIRAALQDKSRRM